MRSFLCFLNFCFFQCLVKYKDAELNILLKGKFLVFFA